MKHKRRWILAVVITTILIWLLWPEPAGPFASGPQVAGGPDLRVVPPDLCIPSAECFENEGERVLLNYQASEGDVRFSFDPDNSGDRVFDLAECPARPNLTAGGFIVDQSLIGRLLGRLGLREDPTDNPAVVICAEGDERWHDGLGEMVARTACDYSPRLYLAGRRPNGKLGALPLLVDMTSEFKIRSGVAVFSFGVIDTTTVAVLRRGSELRLRWGSPLVEADLPALARHLETFEGPGSEAESRCTVRLLIGAEVTYEDLLRVVECAGGDRRVVFWGALHSFELRRGARYLPVLSAKEKRSAEGLWLRDFELVRYRIFYFPLKGNLPHPSAERGIDDARSQFEQTLKPEDGHVVLSIDRRLAWDRLRPVLRALHDINRVPLIRFALEDPVLWDYHHLPLPPPDEKVTDFANVTGRKGETSGEVLHRIVRLAAEGARRFKFP